jgi:hypothetical protein
MKFNNSPHFWKKVKVTWETGIAKPKPEWIQGWEKWGRTESQEAL